MLVRAIHQLGEPAAATIATDLPTGWDHPLIRDRVVVTWWSSGQR